MIIEELPLLKSCDLFEEGEDEDGEGGVGDVVEGQGHTVHQGTFTYTGWSIKHGRVFLVPRK